MKVPVILLQKYKTTVDFFSLLSAGTKTRLYKITGHIIKFWDFPFSLTTLCCHVMACIHSCRHYLDAPTSFYFFCHTIILFVSYFNQEISCEWFTKEICISQIKYLLIYLLFQIPNLIGVLSFLTIISSLQTWCLY